MCLYLIRKLVLLAAEQPHCRRCFTLCDYYVMMVWGRSYHSGDTCSGWCGFSCGLSKVARAQISFHSWYTQTSFSGWQRAAFCSDPETSPGDNIDSGDHFLGGGYLTLLAKSPPQVGQPTSRSWEWHLEVRFSPCSDIAQYTGGEAAWIAILYRCQSSQILRVSEPLEMYT